MKVNRVERGRYLDIYDGRVHDLMIEKGTFLRRYLENEVVNMGFSMDLRR